MVLRKMKFFSNFEVFPFKKICAKAQNGQNAHKNVFMETPLVLGKYQYQGDSKNTPTDTPPCANKGVGIMEKGYSFPKIPLREKAR